MRSSKPLAMLSPSLLARKGGAKPAMRSPANVAANLNDATASQLNEDLGYDDLGEGQVIALTPGSAIAATTVPQVLRQQQALAKQLPGPAKTRRSALAEGRSAAFTLRLDADRHLQLRMACTLSNRSAQQLVTDALDHMIAELPDVAMLVAHAAKRR